MLTGAPMQQMPENLIERAEFREREGIFRNRRHAGRVLADMMADRLAPDCLVLAVPAGGVPVACTLAEMLALESDVVVVSKITFPWNSEAGYGAVAQNGLVRLNDRIMAEVRLNQSEIHDGISTTTAKVNRRIKAFRGDHTAPDIRRRPAVIVDDGLASGTTMSVAIEAVTEMGAASISVAIPTGHLESISRISVEVERIYCANVRSGMRFAVAAAYQQWSDVAESEAIAMMSKRDRPAEQ
ncbi:MAG: phosphoribosyltransferase family protein [Desulfobacteraceae bacterium]